MPTQKEVERAVEMLAAEFEAAGYKIEMVNGKPLGTVWVAPGEGSTWLELKAAFENTTVAAILSHAIYSPLGDKRTNLKLTGAALTDYDRERWASGQVE